MRSVRDLDDVSDEEEKFRKSRITSHVNLPWFIVSLPYRCSDSLRSTIPHHMYIAIACSFQLSVCLRRMLEKVDFLEH